MHAMEQKPSLGDRIKRLFCKREQLSWHVVQAWISENLPADWVTGNTPFQPATRIAYVELRRGKRMSGGVSVTATYVIGQGQAEPVLSKTWETDELDEELLAMFGNEQFIRINI